jgi:hypothetical protein
MIQQCLIIDSEFVSKLEITLHIFSQSRKITLKSGITLNTLFIRMNYLRRLCILDKFNRKYKVVAKIKHIDPMLGQCCYACVRLQDAGYYLVKIIEKELLTT